MVRNPKAQRWVMIIGIFVLTTHYNRSMNTAYYVRHPRIGCFNFFDLQPRSLVAAAVGNSTRCAFVAFSFLTCSLQQRPRDVESFFVAIPSSTCSDEWSANAYCMKHCLKLTARTSALHAVGKRRHHEYLVRVFFERLWWF